MPSRWSAGLRVVRLAAAALLVLLAFALPARAGLPVPFAGQTWDGIRALVLAQAGGGNLAPSPGSIVHVLSVGSVLTEDGTIWQYLPDRGRWVTIDESFRLQNRERAAHVLPLPVPVSSIREMQTFGFILTDTGDCWLYDLGKDSWQKLPAPQR